LKQLNDEVFTINYPYGYNSDAKKILEYAKYAQRLLTRIFPFKILDKINIFLYTEPSKVNGEITYTVMRSDYINLKIHLITPTVAIPTSSWIDDVFYKANIIHECTHILIGQWIYKVTGKWMGNYLPEWFSEGIAGYIPYYCSTPEIYQKYRPRLDKIYEMVRKGDGIFHKIRTDVYYGGSVLVKYMYEKYGETIVNKMIISNSDSWREAIQQEIGISYNEFKDNWLIWACEKVGK